MAATPDPSTRSADRVTATTGTTTSPGEEVNVVSESRRSRRNRAWDEMSEIDRAVLLETVRQRRAAQESRRRVENEVYRLRSLR